MSLSRYSPSRFGLCFVQLLVDGADGRLVRNLRDRHVDDELQSLLFDLYWIHFDCR